MRKGGTRTDLGRYFRSSWEANYARYLNHLKDVGVIADWQYEAKIFEFPVKRGTREYRPDFLVTYPDGRLEFHEVKGYMDQRSRTALKRMAKYYPDVPVVLIDKKVYKDIEAQFRGEIENWEYS